MDNLFIQILILILLILFNAFFSMSEIALITLNDNKIKKMANEGDKKAEKIVALTSNSSKFLATIQVGVTLSGFLTSASAAQSFSSLLSSWLSFLPFSDTFISGISTVIITLILSYFSLVFGELVPKKIGMQYSELISFKIISLLQAIANIFNPFIQFLSVSTNLVVKLFKLNSTTDESSITEEEILMMIDVGKEKGVIEDITKDMINNIFDFDNTSVSEVMTHRTEIGALEDTSSVLDVVDLAISVGYSRIPIFKEDLDTIVGVVYVKDLLKYISKEIPIDLDITEIMRPVIFVPETKRCNELFAEMTASKNQIAIVVDEYGGTEGIVTMEDLIEFILGSIQDEYDNEKEEIHIVNENTFSVEGSTDIEELSDLLQINLPKGDYDTIAGLMVAQLGRIPKYNEHPSIQINNLIFTVEEVIEHRISKILIERKDHSENKS